MIVFDNYELVDFEQNQWYKTFPRVVVSVYPAKRGHWWWEVSVNTGQPIWTHWHKYDGSRWGLTRAVKAAILAGEEVEHASWEEQRLDKHDS